MSALVYFVDDDPFVISSLRRQMRRFLRDLEVRYFQSAHAVLEAAALETPDMLVSDNRMPEMDGFQLLSHFSELYPAAIRIALTGGTATGDAEKLKSVVHEVVFKPHDAETLAEKILDWLGERESGTTAN